MKNFIQLLALFFLFANVACSQDNNYNNADFMITNASVNQDHNLELLVWEISVKGKAGQTVPIPAGQLNGAPVLGYVFPTTLKPGDVDFSHTEGIVALALTSHPDFDDTPLWDEDSDTDYGNDGIIWHPHWVVLNEDKSVKGGLAVKQFDSADQSVQLPPTNPGMPMYMDSPGYPVITKGQNIRVVVPLYRMNNQTDFKFDAVACYMQVNTEDSSKPMLGVYEVFSVSSGDLSLPYAVKH